MDADELEVAADVGAPDAARVAASARGQRPERHALPDLEARVAPFADDLDRRRDLVALHTREAPAPCRLGQGAVEEVVVRAAEADRVGSHDELAHPGIAGFGDLADPHVANALGDGSEHRAHPACRYADCSSSGCSRSSLGRPEKRSAPRSITCTRPARARATAANCSISSTPTPDSTMRRMTGTSRCTTTGARPSDSSSMSTNRGCDTIACASTTICCSPPESMRAWAFSRLPSSGNSASARSRPSRPSARDIAYVATWRLSSTVSAGSSRRPSGTMATPARRMRSGRRDERTASSRRTVPLSGRKTPPTASTSVDLPAPFGPRRAVTSPAGMSSDTPRTTGRPPRATTRSCSWRLTDPPPVQVLGDGADARAEMIGLLVRQTCGRLVEQHDARPADDRSGHLHQPPLARAQRADLRGGVDLESDEAQGAANVLVALAAPLVLGVLPDHGHVVEDGEPLDRLLGLERAPQAPAGTPEVRHAQQVVAEHMDLDGGRLHEAAHHVEERGLAGAVGADQPAGARVERDRHGVERLHAAEAHGQVGDLDHGASSRAAWLRWNGRLSRPARRPRSRGSCTAMPSGAVISTCRIPTPKRIVSRSGGSPQLSSRAGSSLISSPAATAPHSV